MQSGVSSTSVAATVHFLRYTLDLFLGQLVRVDAIYKGLFGLQLFESGVPAHHPSGHLPAHIELALLVMENEAITLTRSDLVAMFFVPPNRTCSPRFGELILIGNGVHRAHRHRAHQREAGLGPPTDEKAQRSLQLISFRLR